MWPVLLDMTKDECKRTLRRMELETYGNMVSVFRAQGELSTEKNKILEDVASVLKIPPERHRAEIRRAVNDEKLTTVAFCITGKDTSDEWALEGRRLIPLMPRLSPQTAYSIIADNEANKASLENEKLPLPAQTERKRPLQTSTTETLNKNVTNRDTLFRVPSDVPSKSTALLKTNMDDMLNKKRKTGINMESSSLAQHLMMNPTKLNRVQQLYRQKTKPIIKYNTKPQQHHHQQRPHPPNPKLSSNFKTINLINDDDDIVNTVQEVPIPVPKQQHIIENKIINQVTIPSSSSNTTILNETIKTKPSQTIIKVTNNSNHTSNNNNNSNNNNSIISQAIQHQPAIVSHTSEIAQQKSIKICPAKKLITPNSTIPRTSSSSTPQKVIIVSSTSQNQVPANIQRNLSNINIPLMKSIPMKTLDKMKIISSPNVQNIGNVQNQKPKMLTLQTKNKGKSVSIPFIPNVQLQSLQSKGTIKMLPLNSTTTVTTTTSASSLTGGLKSVTVSQKQPIYIMNTTPISVKTSDAETIENKTTESFTVTPVVTTSSSNVSGSNNNNTIGSGSGNVIILKNELVRTIHDPLSSMPIVIKKASHEMDNNNEIIASGGGDGQKSSVLAEILKASGVLPNDYTDLNENDIESQITQLTEIPNSNSHVDNIPPAALTSSCSNNITITTSNNTTISSTANISTLTKQNQETIKVDETKAQQIDGLTSDLCANNENIDDNLVNLIEENAQNVTEFEETVVDSNNYIIVQNNDVSRETILLNDNSQSSEEVVELMKSLDTETQMCPVKTSQENVENNQSDSYVIQMQMESLLQNPINFKSNWSTIQKKRKGAK